MTQLRLSLEIEAWSRLEDAASPSVREKETVFLAQAALELQKLPLSKDQVQMVQHLLAGLGLSSLDLAKSSSKKPSSFSFFKMLRSSGKPAHKFFKIPGDAVSFQLAVSSFSDVFSGRRRPSFDASSAAKIENRVSLLIIGPSFYHFPPSVPWT